MPKPISTDELLRRGKKVQIVTPPSNKDGGALSEELEAMLFLANPNHPIIVAKRERSLTKLGIYTTHDIVIEDDGFPVVRMVPFRHRTLKPVFKLGVNGITLTDLAEESIRDRKKSHNFVGAMQSVIGHLCRDTLGMATYYPIVSHNYIYKDEELGFNHNCYVAYYGMELSYKKDYSMIENDNSSCLHSSDIENIREVIEEDSSSMKWNRKGNAYSGSGVMTVNAEVNCRHTPFIKMVRKEQNEESRNADIRASQGASLHKMEYAISFGVENMWVANSDDFSKKGIKDIIDFINQWYTVEHYPSYEKVKSKFDNAKLTRY